MYFRKHSLRRNIKIAGLIYEDEIDELKKHIPIIKIEFAEKRICAGQELSTYQVTILAKDLDKLKEIMRDTDYRYNVRRR